MILAIYYASLAVIHQTTQLLQDYLCPHCALTGYLRSHGFVYRKQAVARERVAVGKRVFCSNRDGNGGCGRTVQLRLDEGLIYLHYSAVCLMIFMLFLLTGCSIQLAYFAATGTADPRNAYRWLNKLMTMQPTHRATLSILPPTVTTNNPRRACLCSTMAGLRQCFGTEFIASFQHERQRSFIRY